MGDLIARALAKRSARALHPLNHPRALATRRLAFHLPVPTIRGPLLENTAPGWPDGARYISILRAEGVLPSPIDRWYAYVGSHDGSTIWLATAPALLGPWTWRQPVLTLQAMSPPFSSHLSSPSAVLADDGTVYLYVHGVYSDGGYSTQPTALATSQDGVAFTRYGDSPVIVTHPNHGRKFYGLSTSYARVIRDGSLWLAFFQANWSSVVSVGVALSEDGLTWSVRRRPLFGNNPGELGPFAPIPVPLWGRWLMLYEHVQSGPPTSMAAHVSVSGDVLGEYEPYGVVISHGGMFNEMEWPFPVVDGDKLYLFFGASPAGGGQFAIYVAEFALGGPQ